MQTICIIGAGAWGTALAQCASRAGRDVRLWAREKDVVHAINQRNENMRFLPGVALEPGINATNDIDAAATNADAILLVTPAQHLRALVHKITLSVGAGAPLVICTKGIEQHTGKLMSDIVAEAAPDHPIAVLSGPTFAREVADGLPAAVALASNDDAMGRALVLALGGSRFRPYYVDDVIGAEVGGTVKNVLAIAAGIATGRGLGYNARAAIITRGFAEMTRLAIARGGRAETLAGLSGLGDLLLTCTSDQSRNFSLGTRLGGGEALDDILASREAVSEGVTSAPAVAALAVQLGVDMPIVHATNAVLHSGADIDETIGGLLARPFTNEHPAKPKN
ncbi:MAG: NAD(P)-dependent glycerol-3-phosphate dehydrogenase [Alphaproteobacteria bacterium]|nr:NAD(P)-dependent glycerol-3-phosphate dehydrogenase [Alphaproteobacteria bacterium]